MAQQPNLEPPISDLPRPEPHPGPPRPWRPHRPGDVVRPEDVPRGGLFGTPGPDAGYVFELLAARDLSTAAGEHRDDAIAVVGAVALARASRAGRAPTAGDVDHALTLLGYLGGGVDSAVIDELVTWRAGAFAGACHDPEAVRELVAGIPETLLDADLDDLRRRLAAGERPFPR